ncbi:MAG: hypothetical protein WDN50_00715 [Bradyrhizobium sp.]
MSTLRQHDRNQPGEPDDRQTGEVSRRTMLAGAMATTAVAAAGPIDTVYAQDADPKQDMVAFLLLSSALTGVHVVNLAPEFGAKPDILKSDPGVDPIQVKDNYFGFAKNKNPTLFGKLLQIAKDHPLSAPDIINAVNANDDTKFMARSIVLMWYLGSWYDPNDLRSKAAGSKDFLKSQVVSATAYTQGLVWQIAQAHPMGYSNLQFGYWSREPVDPNDQNVRSDLGFITPTIP